MFIKWVTKKASTNAFDGHPALIRAAKKSKLKQKECTVIN